VRAVIGEVIKETRRTDENGYYSVGWIVPI
jgi:hypothetical protein